MAGNSQAVADMRAIGRIARDRYGLNVMESVGWVGRGRSSAVNYRAVLCHHTAATVDIDWLLVAGRADLPGPLCNFALHRDGTVVLIASGRANHAGVGILPSSESYGIEATGPIPPGNKGRDAFPQYDEYVKLVAAILDHHDWGVSGRVFGHKETARPLGRKIDPSFDMPGFRASVVARRTIQVPSPLDRRADMFLLRCDGRPLLLVAGDRRVALTSNTQRSIYIDAGVPEYNLSGHEEEYALAASLLSPS